MPLRTCNENLPLMGTAPHDTRDNESLALRCLAHTFHITKVALLSIGVVIFVVMIPLGIAAGRLGWNSPVVFTINFFAVVPLAAVLAFAAREISLNHGKVVNGFLNVTSGNIVEFIFGIVALKKEHIDIAQASMVGSILTNLLLVTGTCFLLGGMIHRGSTGNGAELVFASATAQTTCSLMAFSSASLIIPAALYAVLDQDGLGDKDQSILVLSRGTAIILLLIYVLYLAFKLHTHCNLFEAESQLSDEHQEPQEPQEPTLGAVSAVAVLIAAIILVFACADCLVGSINGLVAISGISRAFVGFILIPAVGNAVELVAAIMFAVRGKMDLAMKAVASSTSQIAFLITPSLVISSWISGSNLNLRLETFQIAAISISVLINAYTVRDGKCNYLEGAMLLGLYVIFASAPLFIPDRLFSGQA